MNLTLSLDPEDRELLKSFLVAIKSRSVPEPVSVVAVTTEPTTYEVLTPAPQSAEQAEPSKASLADVVAFVKDNKIPTKRVNEILAKYGTTRARDLSPEQMAEFIIDLGTAV